MDEFKPDVEVTHQQGLWTYGRLGDLSWSARCYSNPHKSGIKAGRVMALSVTKNNKLIFHYDRGPGMGVMTKQIERLIAHLEAI